MSKGATSLRLAILLLVLAVGTGCDRIPEELHPELMVQDSLGLTEKDAVYRISLTVVDGVETADPLLVEMEYPGYVSFISGDQRVRRLVPDLTQAAVETRAFMEALQPGSPPLIQLDAQWVVDFRTAVAGDYHFRIIGSASEGSIQVRVPVRD